MRPLFRNAGKWLVILNTQRKWMHHFWLLKASVRKGSRPQQQSRHCCPTGNATCITLHIFENGTGLPLPTERYWHQFSALSVVLRSFPTGVTVAVGLRWCGMPPPSIEWRISMSKSAKKRSPAKSAPPAKAAKPSSRVADNSKTRKPNPNSKQSQVIAMLQSSTGATVTAMMTATGWQKHSVRGFLAGVVRKPLKLKLASTKVGDDRIYRIAAKIDKPGAEEAKRQAA